MKHFGTLFFRWFVLALFLSGIAQPVAAQEPPPQTFGGDFWTQPKLTGDWGGLRDRWAAKGFTIDLNTVYIPQGVASGGLPGVSNDVGNTLADYAHLTLDTGKAGLWQGGSLSLRLENRVGVSALEKAATISPVNSAAVFPNSLGNLDKSVFGLTELTYTQFLSPKIGVYGGLINALDADDNPIAGNLRRNATFLNSSFLASMVEIAEGPSVALGAGAIYNGAPTVTGSLVVMGSEETATRNPFDNWNGTTIGTEWHFDYKLLGAPGGQELGLISSLNRTRTNIFQDPRTFFANIVTTQSIPTTTANSWAIYYNSYQYIQGDQQHGWGPFLRAGLSDGSPNPIRWNIAGGVGGKGLIPDRDADGWGVGIYHLQPSGGGFLTAANLRGETGGEVYYNIAFTAAIHTTLDTQLVSSARPRQETAWVLGARLNVDF